MSKTKQIKPPLKRCSLKHWDCIQADEKCRCMLLTGMEIVEKYHHCSFYKKRGEPR